MAQSGNRPPRRGQPTKSGSRPAGNASPTPANGHDASAAERARERLAQRSSSGQKRQSASQRARSAAPATSREKAQAAARRERAGGPSSRRGSARRLEKRSTAMTVAIFGTVFVLLAVLVIVLVSLTGGSSAKAGSGFGMKPAPASVVNAISNVSASDFAVAGTSITSSGPWTQFLSAPKNPQPLTSGGKPLIVYVGSNYCPYCAATRWPLAVALARFGTFKGLKITSSGLSDEYPGTNTLSFYHVTYKSPYIAFLSSEQCSDLVASTSSPAVQDCFGYEPLEKLTGTALRAFSKYDAQPYQTANNAGGIPFVDFGSQLIEDGAFMDPTILAGYSHEQIAQSLSENPAASPAQTILDGANYYSAEICKLTGGKPGSVCDMPVVKQAAASLPKP